MNPLLTTCPVCGQALHATRLHCGACHTGIEGQFSLGRLGRLSRDQLDMVELIVKHRGNIGAVAAEMKVAYNTARSRLDDLVGTMGFGAAAEPPPPIDRKAILERLAKKEISAEEAMAQLGQTGGS